MTENNNPGCLTAFLRFFGLGRESGPESLPYRLKDRILTESELSFYLVLKSILGERLTICPKVRLSDIFFVARRNENKGAYNRINQKHVDFLICDPRTMKPLFGVELDDSSHKRSDREARDELVDQVFAAAGLPLVRVPARTAYSRSEINALISQALGTKPAIESPSEEEKADNPGQDKAPLCPKCGIPMVLRTAARGANAGRQFYGCVNYPNCREVLPYQPV